jgi:hypothetical protein
MKAHKPFWKHVFIFLIFFWSCEIEDEHGTIAFVLSDKFESTRGKSLGEFFTHENFLMNEQSQEIYLINCGGGICEPHIITSLNYESGSTRKIYEGQDPQLNIILTDFIQSTNTLYFWENNYLEQRFIALDVNTFEQKIIKSGYGNVVVSPDFVFVNYEYDSLYIKKIDRNGNEEILGIRGNVYLASQDSPEILIQNIDQPEWLIYDYKSNQITFRKHAAFFYSDQFFRWSTFGLFYTTDDGSHIRNFRSDDILFKLAASDSYICFFNPACQKVVYGETKIVMRSSEYLQFWNFQLIVKDLQSDNTDVLVSTINESIGVAKLLNDGQTIIYTLNGKLYKSTIE